MTEIERIMHVIVYKRKHGVLDLDVLILLAVAQAGACNLMTMHEMMGAGCYDAVRIRVARHLVPQGLLVDGGKVQLENRQRVTVYALSNEGADLVVAMLSLQVKTTKRVELAARVWKSARKVVVA